MVAGDATLAAMKHAAALSALLALLIAAILMAPLGPAGAADVGIYRSAPAVVAGPILPFPRSERTEAVWASGGCWTACSAHTTWALDACLYRDTQGHCLERADTADRACQRSCRTRGGPFLPID